MNCREIIFSGHAIRRMFERRISADVVRAVIADAEVVAEYSDDHPLPSRLMLGRVDGDPLHVVLAFHEGTSVCHVITVYRPDPDLWEADFKTRRTP